MTSSNPEQGRVTISKKEREQAVDRWLGFAKLPFGHTVDDYLRSIRDR